MQKRNELIINQLQSADSLNVATSNGVAKPSLTDSNKSAPSVRDVIGLSLPHIGSFKQMDNKKQVVALIDDVS